MRCDIQDYCLFVPNVLSDKFFRKINVFDGAICGQIQQISEFLKASQGKLERMRVTG